MSMYRQLWSAIVVSLVFAWLASIAASTLSTRAYLIEQLRVKNQDNASALALSLSQTVNDPIQVELALMAQFDSGNYRFIRFTHANGQVVFERRSDDMVSDVPVWFVNSIPLSVPSGHALVSSGWRQLGAVTLDSDSAYAYKSLWDSTLRMSVATALACMLGCFWGAMILRQIKRPLDAVVDQAIAIVDRRFITIPEPRTPELRRLAAAMNLTVRRLKEMFEEEAMVLDALRQEANYDHLTGLPNRKAFMTQLTETLRTNESALGGCMFLRIAQLTEINKQHGRMVADQIILQIAAHLRTAQETLSNSFAGRLNGADFALTLPTDQPLPAVQILVDQVIQDIKPYLGSEFCVSVGVATYQVGMELSVFLGRIDMALAAAEVRADNAVCTADSMETSWSPRSMTDWTILIKQAITNRALHFLSAPVSDLQGGVVHLEGALRISDDEASRSIPPGTFLPIAERMMVTDQLDLIAVELAIVAIEKDVNLVGHSVNLSTSSLRVATFIPALKRLIRTSPSAATKLWLEFSEAGVLRDLEGFREFCGDLKATGVRLGVKHFGRQFDQLGRLHDLACDFVKVDAIFIRDVHQNFGNQIFLKGLVHIVQGIGMQVMAEGVVSKDELGVLRKLGFDGATGPAVSDA